MSQLISDRVVRAVMYVAISLLLLFTWGFGAVAKLSAAGQVPEWFTQTFEKTFLNTFPGLWASFYSIAVLEAVVALLAIGSLITGEAFRPRKPVLLVVSILISMLLFVQLNFGKQLLQDFTGAHELFMYFAGALIMLLAVRHFESSNRAATTSAT
ncbi:MAG TPA: hypothetical protein VK157_10155 [Phycisphaerales bacterium]|nr:hypothetical protein [Phycisphaerales bacterium]